jgi:hypothetical protein
MAYAIQAGIQISLNGTTWYKLTDHNRREIQVNPSLIESAKRMANAKMRKYVIAKKQIISTSWETVPSKTSLTVDGNYSSAWLDAFYAANNGVPIYLKLVASSDTTPSKGSAPVDSTFVTSLTNSTTYQVFITRFSSTTTHRNINSDYVNMEIEFTEI